MNHKKSASITKIESFGVEEIPAEERTATPFDLFRLIFGGANTFSTCVLGSFPIVFGLSFQAGLLAIITGVLFGAIILAPMGVFGARNGTNNAVSSGAHFGVHGRIVGSFLSLLTAIAFFSLSVWSSGDALVGAAKRLFVLPDGNFPYVIVYAVFAGLVLLVCIYGFKFMLLVNKIAVLAASILFLLGVFAFADVFNWQYVGQVQQGEKGFWAAFVGAALIAFSNPISFGAFLGDWSRYIPRETPSWKIMFAVIASQIGTLIPFIFGLATATIVAIQAPHFIVENDYVGGLIHIAPTWYFLPLCLIAMIGGMSTGTTALYGTGLDMSSIFTKQLTRVNATILVGILSICFIFVGRFMTNLTQSVSTFVALIVTCSSPWIIIMVIGFIKRRGYYKTEDLQVFALGIRGGIYWFHHGWNWRGMGAWVISALIGICFVNLPNQFVGILGNLYGGIDMSLPVTLSVAAILYLLLLYLFPENSEVYGDFKAVDTKQPCAVKSVEYSPNENC